MKWLNF